MARIRRLRPPTLGRYCSQKTLMSFLMYVGRIGKILSDRGVDPAKVYFIPGSFEVLDKINPKVNLTENDWKEICQEASLWFKEKYFPLWDRKISKIVNIECMSLAHFLLFDVPAVSPFFNEVIPLTHQDWNCYKSLITVQPYSFYSYRNLNGGQRNFYNLSYLTDSGTNRFSLVKDETCQDGDADSERVEVFLSPDVHSLPHTVKFKINKSNEEEKKGFTATINWFSFKLSEPGKQAVLRYFKRESQMASSFDISLPEETLHFNIGGTKYSFKHSSIRQVGKVLRRTFQTILTEVLDQAFDQFTEYFKKQEVFFNNIPLPEDVKKLLSKKIRPFVVVDRFTFTTEVFRVLRSGKVKNLDTLLMTLLTSEKEVHRESGLALNSIIQDNKDEEEDNEENE